MSLAQERAPGIRHQEERTPSYCDRILWKSLESLQGCTTQQKLASPSEVSTSDHKPVYAQFTVKTPNALGQLFQKKLCPEAFPVVRVSHLKARDVPSGPGAKFRVVFVVTPLELNTTKYESGIKSMREPAWKADDLPLLRPAVTCQEELNTCTLLMVLYNKNVRLGCVGLRFPGCDPSHVTSKQRISYDFHAPIVNRSCSFATGHFSGTLDVNWSEEAIHAANQAARLSTQPRQQACCILQ